jgi:hypothetical protein
MDSRLYIPSTGICQKEDAHRSIVTHCFKERGIVPDGQGPNNELLNKTVLEKETPDNDHHDYWVRIISKRG